MSDAVLDPAGRPNDLVQTGSGDADEYGAAEPETPKRGGSKKPAEPADDDA